MNSPLTLVRSFDAAPITTLLCDADDNLFGSERPAFDASTEVTNRFLARFGVTAPLSCEELRKRAVGKNFRTTALDLSVQCAVPLEETLARRCTCIAARSWASPPNRAWPLKTPWPG